MERYLLAATGLMQLENGSWGEAPVLCEGIPLTLKFTENVGVLRFYPLDQGGNRKKILTENDGRVVCKPEYETIWYEIEIEK